MDKHMFRNVAAVLYLLSALIVPSLADEHHPLGVVELFTSQGCSSCPPADKVLAELAKSDNIVALAYHVDYWDYLGWRDTLGSQQFTERQYAYANTLGSRSVYTPQAVLNGRKHVNGANRKSILSGLDNLQNQSEGLQVTIDIRRNGNSVVIDTGTATGPARDAHVVLVYFDSESTVAIQRGENSGRTIRYANAVTGIQTVGMWHGDSKRFELPVLEVSKQGDSCAVLLQVVSPDGLPSAILGAAIIDGN